jgi:hypothetical protein
LNRCVVSVADAAMGPISARSGPKREVALKAIFKLTGADL